MNLKLKFIMGREKKRSRFFPTPCYIGAEKKTKSPKFPTPNLHALTLFWAISLNSGLLGGSDFFGLLESWLVLRKCTLPPANMLPNPTPPTGFPCGFGCLGAAGVSSSFGKSSSLRKSIKKWKENKEGRKRKENTQV